MSGITANPFVHSSKFNGKLLHLGVSGSIACYKSCELLRTFISMGMRVSATLTQSATKFITPMLLAGLGANPVYGEMFQPGQVFDHLEPGRNAEALVICPATANIIAKFAQGLADDMLSAQFLAFCGPKVIAPAMNPRMWENKITQLNIRKLKDSYTALIPPGYGKSACGEEGYGRLAELPQIFFACLKALTVPDMKDTQVLVTLGPTREYWDAVRFWSNPSSGKMGAALATCAWLRGAQVTAVCGPGISVDLPCGINIHKVTSAREMLDIAIKLWPQMDMGMFCAAVGDFAPVNGPKGKFKKQGIETLSIDFVANEDILASCVSRKKPNQKILAFAAEAAANPEELLQLARYKLERKRPDLLAANPVGGPRSAFGSNLANMVIVDDTGEEAIWPEQSKADIAWELVSWLLKI